MLTLRDADGAPQPAAAPVPAPSVPVPVSPPTVSPESPVILDEELSDAEAEVEKSMVTKVVDAMAHVGAYRSKGAPCR